MTEPRRSSANSQSGRRGFERIWHAGLISLQGLRTGWGETAFRQEAMLAIVAIPLAFWLGQDWVQVALLVGSVMLVLIVELLNTAVESAIDRIGPEWHDLSKRAQDTGSATELLALLLAGGIWLACLWHRFAI